jgi:hypothetical protein
VSSRHVPEVLESVAMQCIARLRADRVQNGAEVVRILQADW